MAIALVTNSFALGSGNYPPNSVTLGASAPLNGLIYAAVAYTSSGPGAYGISGSLNGAYTLLKAFDDPTNNVNIALYGVQVTTAGADVISTTGSPNDYGYIQAVAFSGFTGSISVDASAAGNASGQTANTYSLACSAGNANEVLVGIVLPSTGSVNQPTGWTALGSPAGGSANMFYAIQSSSGSLPLAGGLGSTANWDAITAGMYQQPAAGGLYVPISLVPGALEMALCL